MQGILVQINVLLQAQNSNLNSKTMQKVMMIGLQFSALVPMLVILVYKPSLNVFFKLLFASILLSLFFDFLGLIGEELISNNMVIYCLYFLLNSFLIVFMWLSASQLRCQTSWSFTLLRADACLTMGRTPAGGRQPLDPVAGGVR